MIGDIPTANYSLNISNNSTNATIQPPSDGYCSVALTDGEIVFLVFGHLVVLFTSISVNSLIIHIICCYRSTKNAFNILIVNMAAADILDSVVANPTNIAFLFLGNYYPSSIFGEILCRLNPFLQNVAVSASILTLTVIAIDRYFAIVHVLRTPMDLRAVRRAVIGIWLSSAIFFSYTLFRFALNHMPDRSYARCVVYWISLDEDDMELEYSLHVADMLAKLILHYALPLLIMIVFYSIILIHLWQTKTPGELNDKHQRRLETQKRKIIKMLVTIVTVFALFWFPVHLYHALLTFRNNLVRCKLPIIALFLMMLISHSTAAINPCLYLIFNQNFRDGMKHLCNKVNKSLCLLLHTLRIGLIDT